MRLLMIFYVDGAYDLGKKLVCGWVAGGSLYQMKQ